MADTGHDITDLQGLNILPQNAQKMQKCLSNHNAPPQEFRLLLIQRQFSGYKTEYYELQFYGCLFNQSHHSEVDRQLLPQQKQLNYHANFFDKFLADNGHITDSGDKINFQKM